MITTQFDETVPLIHHRVSGEITLSDVGEAMNRTATLHEHHDAAVLWDLRELVLNAVDEHDGSGISRLIELMKGRVSGRKRAFVVGDSAHIEILERILGGTTAPWPWAVFTDLDQATAWVVN